MYLKKEQEEAKKYVYYCCYCCCWLHFVSVLSFPFFFQTSKGGRGGRQQRRNARIQLEIPNTGTSPRVWTSHSVNTYWGRRLRKLLLLLLLDVVVVSVLMWNFLCLLASVFRKNMLVCTTLLCKAMRRRSSVSVSMNQSENRCACLHCDEIFYCSRCCCCCCWGFVSVVVLLLFCCCCWSGYCCHCCGCCCCYSPILFLLPRFLLLPAVANKSNRRCKLLSTMTMRKLPSCCWKLVWCRRSAKERVLYKKQKISNFHNFSP